MFLCYPRCSWKSSYYHRYPRTCWQFLWHRRGVSTHVLRRNIVAMRSRGCTSCKIQSDFCGFLLPSERTRAYLEMILNKKDQFDRILQAQQFEDGVHSLLAIEIKWRRSRFAGFPGHTDIMTFLSSYWGQPSVFWRGKRIFISGVNCWDRIRMIWELIKSTIRHIGVVEIHGLPIENIYRALGLSRQIIRSVL
jgi:hypothetical protein